ncbi:hypothetical protein ACIBFB_01960 [Nocardiopsis sp. NPDC050513]|uniref:hypothetical protein n=1 Tax=Nocardiopsis sp. NPDC050513 TaxID=3364338 RepID=UPI0037943AC4
MAKDSVARATARMLERRCVTRSGVTRISVVAAIAAAVWFSQADTVGCLVGSALLGVVLFCDSVRARIRTDRRDALTMWLAAMLGQLREYAVYVGLALGAVAAGIQGAWGWAAGALIALALRDTFLVVRSAPSGAGTGGGAASGGGAAARRDGGVQGGPRRQGERGAHADAHGDGGPHGPTAPHGRRGPNRLLTGLVPPPPRGTQENDPRLTDRLLGGPDGRPAASRNGVAPGSSTGTAVRDAAETTAEAADAGTHGEPDRAGGAPLPAAIRRVMVFSQPTRFLTIAVTTTVWDARVAFLTLVVGCALAVTGELVDPTARETRR